MVNQYPPIFLFAHPPGNDPGILVLETNVLPITPRMRIFCSHGRIRTYDLFRITKNSTTELHDYFCVSGGIRTHGLLNHNQTL